MQKHVLVLTTSAIIFACGAIAASAQQSPGVPTPEAGFSAQQGPGGPMMQQTNKHCVSACRTASNATKKKTTIRAAIEGMAAE